MKITKKEISQFIKEIKNIIETQGWKLLDAGSYIKDKKVFIFGNYAGESVSEAVYNKQYEEIISFDNIIIDYLNKEYDLKTTTDIIYDDINNMIETYKYENETEIRNNIKNILGEQGISIRKMSIDLDMGYSVAHALVNRKSLNTTALERVVEISDYLEVDIEDLYK